MSNNLRQLITPCKGACVKTDDNRLWLVDKVEVDHQGIHVLVKGQGKYEWLPLEKVRCGLGVGMDVIHHPISNAHISLGEGWVREVRKLGGSYQALVEFPEKGKICWLPYERLAIYTGIKTRALCGDFGDDSNADRFRLRTLLYALERQHADIGSFANLDIDPLPHQIGLVHKIITSGNLNWLIAEDVGMGKTIEVGMLLSALMGRGSLRRILLVVPAGLLRQWKEELHYRMNLRDFAIYGQDFHINDLHDWKRYDQVIASIDTIKADKHLELFLAAPEWDLVIFDEAHRLTRSQIGKRFYAADRYKMAAALRQKSSSVLLLTATPHQGKQDKFQALLELLRPELKQQIRRLNANRTILEQMVIRNNKAKAIDQNGQPIFKGKSVKRMEVALSQAEKEFDLALRRYFHNLYIASSKMVGAQARAIGFVMTIYRKLAASSTAAIVTALERRLQRLKLQVKEQWEIPTEPQDERFAGESEEDVVTPAMQFFNGEITALTNLLEQAQKLSGHDSKLKTLMNDVIPTILKPNINNKVVIFTEYKSTQRWLAKALAQRYGENSVTLINGEMDHQERTRQIAKFENEAQFLISTEAGGEGINLHRKCNIMINYDLPWNPMRLVQRIGRLYRYGQKKRVFVFNLHVPLSLDGKLIAHLYDRIEQVVCDMADVDQEFQPGLEAQILGELVPVLNVKEVFEKAIACKEEHTIEEIDKALEEAKEATKKQRELLEYAASGEEWHTEGQLRLDSSYLWTFIKGMLPYLKIEVLEVLHKGKVLKIALPDELAEDFNMKGRQMRITCDRLLAQGKQKIKFLTMDSLLVQKMIETAKDLKFQGRVAAVKQSASFREAFTAMLRWQDYKGKRVMEEFAILGIDQKGKVEINPKELVASLKTHWSGVIDPKPQKNHEKQINAAFALATNKFEEILANRSALNIHPEGLQILGYAQFI